MINFNKECPHFGYKTEQTFVTKRSKAISPIWERKTFDIWSSRKWKRVRGWKATYIYELYSGDCMRKYDNGVLH